MVRKSAATPSQGAAEAMTELQHAMEAVPGKSLAEVIADLVIEIGLPTRLSDLGVSIDQIPELAEKASKDHLSATNPRPATASDYVELLQRAL